MNDQAISALLTEATKPIPTLWFVDEQWLDSPLPRFHYDQPLIISNRYDVYNQLQQAGMAVLFNDFDTSSLENGAFQRICYRVSKEKAAVHHIINQSHRLLAPGGELVLAGAKREGVKTYLDQAGQYFQNSPQSRKQGSIYLGKVGKSSVLPGADLDDRDYRRLRTIATQNGISFLSKPGIFGWDKIDPGSALLVEHLADFFAGNPPQSVLDLGCGYGYLAIMAWQHGGMRVLASDNNAAALIACRANFAAQGIRGQIIAANCGDTISERFPVLLCNPPFHRGFAHDRALTHTFLAAAARLLTSDGRALFVVNRFIPLEQIARQYFRRVATFSENRSFKLIVLA